MKPSFYVLIIGFVSVVLGAQAALAKSTLTFEYQPRSASIVQQEYGSSNGVSVPPKFKLVKTVYIEAADAHFSSNNTNSEYSLKIKTFGGCRVEAPWFESVNLPDAASHTFALPSEDSINYKAVLDSVDTLQGICAKKGPGTHSVTVNMASGSSPVLGDLSIKCTRKNPMSGKDTELKGYVTVTQVAKSNELSITCLAPSSKLRFGKALRKY